MNFTVVFTENAEADMDGLAPGPRAEVNKVLKRLRAGPDRGLDLELVNAKNRYRAYAGRRWRVIFQVLPGRRVQIRRITRRPDAYRGIEHPGYQELQEPRAAYVADEPSVPAALAD